MARPLPYFWHRAEWSPGCWEWRGPRNRDGYGTHTVHKAHRLAYELAVGPIPSGMTIDHLCRNRGCVNPAHLEPVTRGMNSLRGLGASAINASRTMCANGHLFDMRESGARRCRQCLRASQRERYRLRRPSPGKPRGYRAAAPKEVCVNGHPFTEETTYTKPNGHRDCRVCIRRRVSEYRARVERVENAA